jgi:hypothetical protein
MENPPSVDLAKVYPKIGQRESPSILFEELRIPFKKARRKTFWLANEAELEYLYHDFMTAVKGRLRELHPDVNPGRSADFIDFKRRSDAVLGTFHRKGVGGVCALVKAIRHEERNPLKPGKRWSRKKLAKDSNTRFYNKTPCEEIVRMLDEGKPPQFIMKALNTTWKTVCKVNDLLRD